MRRIVKSILCYLVGHQYDPDTAHYYQMFYCLRCKKSHEIPAATWFEALNYRFRWWLGETSHRWRRWWKCRDCGWHFGRHEPESDDKHVPF